MAYYAILDKRNVVVRVIVGRNPGENAHDATWWETYYGGKLTGYDMKSGVDTKGGSALRKNYAGIGYTYDPVLDAFIPPKPFASWVIDAAAGQYKAPVEYPKDGKAYAWDEATVSWVEVSTKK